MENIRNIGSWSQDPVLVINYITKIEKIIMLRRMITNAVMSSGLGIAVCWERSRSESRVIEMRYMKDNNVIGGPITPSNHSFLR